MLLAGCGNQRKWHAMNISGSSPPLAFAMTRAADGKGVTQADYRGRIVLLYFGYTFCPDICPTTLANCADIFHRLGPAMAHIRMLFVTVDPNRDTIPVLKAYLAGFGPGFVGLRGTPDQLDALAKRFHLAYSVSPSSDPAKYQVTHSSAIYVFDRQGDARLLVPSMASQKPDIDGLAADLVRLTNAQPEGWFGWLRSLV